MHYAKPFALLLFGLTAQFCAFPRIAAAQVAPEQPRNESAVPSPAMNMTPNAAARRFDIFEFVVDGNTVLSIPEVEEAVYPFLGEGKTALDVDSAREALEKLYQSRGFQTVQVAIPQQGVESAIIHLQVVESPVGRLRVVGSRFHSLKVIRENAPSVAEGTVINTNDVQKDIAVLNQSPDLTVTPRLKAGEAPGSVDVDLEVQDKFPLHGNLEVNNQYSQATSDLRVIASVGYDNLWQRGHSANVTYQVAPKNPSDAEVLSGSYLMRVPSTSVSLLAYGVLSHSDVAALAETNVVGRGTIYGARAMVSLPGGDNFYQTITAGIDRKNLTQNVITLGAPSNATVLYYPATLAYSANWQMGERASHVGGALNFALPAGSPSAKFDLQRFDALRQYFYVKADANRAQPLPLGFVLYGRAQGQFTDDALLSSEQLSAGGANSVRGYLEAERLGDFGAVATVEMRTPSFGSAVASFINDWRLVAFADGAALGRRNPLPGEKASTFIGSAGLGTRFGAFNLLNGALDVAVALADGAATKEGTTRLHFRVWSGF